MPPDRPEIQPGAAAGEDTDLLTSAGPAAIAVLRAAGPGVRAFAARCLAPPDLRGRAWENGQVWRAALRDEQGALVDDVLVSVHRVGGGPELRIHVHGHPALVRRVRGLLTRHAALGTPADAAPLWPAPDHLALEAWQLAPRMLTSAGVHWVLRQVDFLRRLAAETAADADPARSRMACAQAADRFTIVDWFSRPARVVLLGPPNAGKSTLANALADQPASVVSSTPGTTRDWVETPGEIAGIPVVWVDTAGLRSTTDPLESAAMDATRAVQAGAAAIVLVLDQNGPLQTDFVTGYLNGSAPAVLCWNKADLPETAAPRTLLDWGAAQHSVRVSATQLIGLEELKAAILTVLLRSPAQLALPAAYTQRQADILRAASSAADRKLFQDLLLTLLG